MDLNSHFSARFVIILAADRFHKLLDEQMNMSMLLKSLN